MGINVTDQVDNAFARELETAHRGKEFYSQIEKDLGEIVYPRFRNFKRLDREGLLAIAAQIDASMNTNAIVIKSGQAEIPATFARPKSEVIETRYVVVHAVNHHIFQLFSYRFRMTRKNIRVETRYLPVRFTKHAVERLRERAGEEREAIRDIALSLLESAVFAKLVEDTCIVDHGFQLPIPTLRTKGLLLGTFHALDWTDVGFEMRGGRHSFLPSLYTLWPKGVMYTAVTFVGRKLLTREQADYSALVTRWIKSRPKEYAAITRAMCWPDHMIKPEDDVELSEDLFEVMRYEATNVVQNDRFAKTIQTGGTRHIELGARIQADERVDTFLTRMYEPRTAV
jgi:hypothetical protein